MPLDQTEKDFIHNLAEPFDRLFLQRQKEQVDLFRVICSSLEAVVELPNLFTSFKSDQKTIDKARASAALAQLEIDRNYSSIASQSIIVLWSALEAAIRDFLINWIKAFPKLLESTAISSIKIRFGDYISLSEEDRTRFIVSELERSVSAKFKAGAGRFESVLGEVELGGSINDDVRRNLLELSALRNVLVHNAGHVDEKFMKLCPWLDLHNGHLLSPSPKDYLRYAASVIRYCATIVKRVEILVEGEFNHQVQQSCDEL